jgi:hypothetical protein
MSGCTRLSDRMPDVAQHRALWTPEEAAHLVECAECRAEWELMLSARQLYHKAPTVSDPTGLAATLRRRLTEAKATRTRKRAWSVAGAVAAAAVLVAVLIGRDARPAADPRAVAEVEALVPLPELEGLGTAQLDTLLQSIDRPRPVAGPSSLDASTLGGHEDAELELVFASWEG